MTFQNYKENELKKRFRVFGAHMLTITETQCIDTIHRRARKGERDRMNEKTYDATLWAFHVNMASCLVLRPIESTKWQQWMDERDRWTLFSRQILLLIQFVIVEHNELRLKTSIQYAATEERTVTDYACTCVCVARTLYARYSLGIHIR